MNDVHSVCEGRGVPQSCADELREHYDDWGKRHENGNLRTSYVNGPEEEVGGGGGGEGEIPIISPVGID